jgi:hypothetical protein
MSQVRQHLAASRDGPGRRPLAGAASGHLPVSAGGTALPGMPRSANQARDGADHRTGTGEQEDRARPG